MYFERFGPGRRIRRTFIKINTIYSFLWNQVSLQPVTKFEYILHVVTIKRYTIRAQIHARFPFQVADLESCTSMKRFRRPNKRPIIDQRLLDIAIGQWSVKNRNRTPNNVSNRKSVQLKFDHSSYKYLMHL